MNRTYDVNAIQMTIWFNREGDHDHNGCVLKRVVPHGQWGQFRVGA